VKQKKPKKKSKRQRDRAKEEYDDDDEEYDDDDKFRSISTQEMISSDKDADGFVSHEMGGLDCDDNNPEIYPGAPEIINDGIDQDCDGHDLTFVQNTPCTNPECLEDPEIDEECSHCSNDEEVSEDCF
jgi:hypothetical protein